MREILHVTEVRNTGEAKKSAWETWHAFPGVTEAFLSLSNPQCQLMVSSLALTERFVVLWYDSKIELSNIIEARQQMFSKISVSGRNSSYRSCSKATYSKSSIPRRTSAGLISRERPSFAQPIALWMGMGCSTFLMDTKVDYPSTST